MIKNVFFAILASGFLNLESVQFGQFLISRPSFSGFILGLILGFPLWGFLGGLLIEFSYLDFNPIGGSVPPNSSMAVISMLIFYAIFKYFELAFLFGFSMGFVYSHMDKIIRTMRNKWVLLAQKEIESGIYYFSKYILKSLILEFAIFICFSFFITLILGAVFPFLRFSFSQKITNLFFIGIISISISSLYYRLKNQVAKNE